MAQNEKKLTKRDRVSVWWRSFFLQGSWNYERMQNLGWAFAMIPAIRRLYKTKEERSDALKRHLEFFNTHPYLASPIFGVELALEEQRANGADISDETINGVKVGMMGPLAGVGDPVFWATIRPVLGAFCASLALAQNVLAPIIFFVVWNAIRMGFLWYTQDFGYKQGVNITQDLSGGMLPKITQGASILGMFVLGVLVPRWTTMNFVLQVSKVKNQAANVVDLKSFTESINNGKVSVEQTRHVIDQLVAGKTVDAFKVTTLQDTLNSLLPGLGPLLLLFIVLWLLKRKVNPIWIIFGLFIVGILGFWAGVLG